MCRYILFAAFILFSINSVFLSTSSSESPKPGKCWFQFVPYKIFVLESAVYKNIFYYKNIVSYFLKKLINGTQYDQNMSKKFIKIMSFRRW